MSSQHPFTSQEPKTGDPSLCWEDFKAPRLRRFAESHDNLKLGRYLGSGVDGMVFKARIRGQTEPLAVKIFHFACRPPLIRYGRPDGPGTERYWAFERECINRALLDMIAASRRRAAAAGRQIYIHPRPKTLSQARYNLRAFSDEAVTRPQPKGFVPISSDVQVVDCLGWTEFRGSYINAHFIKAWVDNQESRVDHETYPAIVYQFVAEDGIPDVDTSVSQLDFFHITGFVSVPFNENSWRGKGVLVDFSDIVSYHAAYKWWLPSFYAAEQAELRRTVERRAREGRLGPPPKPINPPPPPAIRHGPAVKRSTPKPPPPLPPPPPRPWPSQEEYGAKPSEDTESAPIM
ncbi:hypothetical protein VTK56DRAFT_1559 [Thermocarpiscus australiensis]